MSESKKLVEKVSCGFKCRCHGKTCTSKWKWNKDNLKKHWDNMPIEHMRFICPSECERNQIYDYLNICN